MMSKEVANSINSIVFSGGGSKGYCYIGVVKYLDETGILPNLKTYSGTSIGSLFATMLSIGYNYKELHDIFVNFDYSDFHNINIFNFFDNYGLDDFSGMISLITKLFDTKHISADISFSDLYKQTGNRLCINAVSLNKKMVVYFNHETTPDMQIMTALKSSMAIPYIFSPVKWNNDIYVDGGLIENFMINYVWPREDNKDQKILGINLTNDTCPTEGQINDIYEYSQQLFTCLMRGIQLKDDQIINDMVIIQIDCKNNSLDFDLDMETKYKLFDIGYEAMLKENL